MGLVRFETDIKEDIKNLVICCKSGSFKNKDASHIIPSELYELIKDKDSGEIGDIVKRFVVKYYKSNKTYISKIIEISAGIWREIEEDFLRQLEVVTGKQLELNSVVACATMARRCPYNSEEKWFMFHLFAHPLQVNKICAHEIMHLHIIDQFDAELSGLSQEEKFILLESLTVLLNQPEFSNIIYAPDKGYKAHEAVQSKISELWQSKKDFNALLEEIIRIIKHK